MADDDDQSESDQSKRVLERYLLEKDTQKNQMMKLAVEFTDKIVMEAFKRSGGRCECTDPKCKVKHNGQCSVTFGEKDRGNEDKNWHAHHIDADAAGGANAVSNCQILCVPCHKSTPSFGKAVT